MAPDSIREGMNELGRMERADKWEWIIERCRKAGEPVATVASRKTPNPRGLYGGLV